MSKMIIYTDGSCIGNGRTNAVGGIGIHFPNKELEDVSKAFRGTCTNQKTELYAILYAIKYIGRSYDLGKIELTIKTDSQYSIDCITKWVYSWVKNGWMTQSGKPVANKEFIEPIYNYCEKYDIVFEHVDAHTGAKDNDSKANAIADSLAVQASKRAKNKSRYRINTDIEDSKRVNNKSRYRINTDVEENSKRINTDVETNAANSKRTNNGYRINIGEKNRRSISRSTSKISRKKSNNKLTSEENIIVELIKR